MAGRIGGDRQHLRRRPSPRSRSCIGQAVLGGIVVRASSERPWWVTAALRHRADASSPSSCIISRRLLYVTGARTKDTSSRGCYPEVRQRLTLFTTIATACCCSSARTSGPKAAGLAFTDWPLMDGRLVPALGGVATPMFLHRVLAALVFVAGAVVGHPRPHDDQAFQGPRACFRRSRWCSTSRRS